jgi:CRP/FNR family transcriptional regulator
MTTALDVARSTRPRGADDVTSSVLLHDELSLGRRKLITLFASSTLRTLKAGNLLAAAGPDQEIYRLRDGWAYQSRVLADARRAIVDVYVPGDVIGLDAALNTRRVQDVSALSAVTIEAILIQNELIKLMADRPTALYIVWLLSKRQRRMSRFLVAISSLDARGRLAMMLLDFYLRLRRQKLISGLTYHLPLTQVQIGNYLGLTVVHVNRVLRSLRAERIASLEKHCVTILDLERLAILAEKVSIASSPAGGQGHAVGEAAD